MSERSRATSDVVVEADLHAREGTTVERIAGQPEQRASLWSDAWLELRHNPWFVVSALVVLLMLAIAIAPQLFTSADPRDCSLTNSLIRPSTRHWFGFDLQGCDYYARVLYGARASIVVGVSVTVASALIAVVGGALAGYYGGLLDGLVARVADIVLALPLFLGGVVILSALGRQSGGIVTVAISLTALSWPTMLRLMRSSVLSAKEQDYVTAAKALGASDLRILYRHLLPNAITPVIVYATITVGIVVALEATLSYLGIGLQLPAISWGLMISDAQDRLLQAPHLLLFPGLFLSITVFAFILMGDALRDAFDPKLR
jgi:oligopeptide transport system permease protein